MRGGDVSKRNLKEFTIISNEIQYIVIRNSKLAGPRRGAPSSEDFERKRKFDTRTRTGTERTFSHDRDLMKYPLGNHDTVEELGSLVQQAQQKAGTKSKRGSGNCTESRSQLFANAVAKFFRDRPSTMLHSEGTLSNHGQQPRAGICAQV